jgi:hypothetical protein
MQGQYERMKRDHGIDQMLKDSEDEAPDQYIGKHISHILKQIFYDRS